MTDEQKKTMTTREVLTVLMQIETLNMRVHETRMMEVGGHMKPTQGIHGAGYLTISPDFKIASIAMGTMNNEYHIETISHAEYDEIEDVLYLEFMLPNEA